MAFEFVKEFLYLLKKLIYCFFQQGFTRKNDWLKSAKTVNMTS